MTKSVMDGSGRKDVNTGAKTVSRPRDVAMGAGECVAAPHSQKQYTKKCSRT